jgi:hypothetical protein
LATVLDQPSPRQADAPPPRAALPEVQGLVDKALPDRLYGWAWNASNPGERVAVELRLGDAPVARAIADLARHDLEKAGVGDGRHAFELPLEAEWTRRASELSVVVRTADGVATPIPMRVRRQAPEAAPPPGAAAAVAGLQRALDGLAAGQERVAAQVADLSARLPGPEERDAVHALVAAQAALSERLDTLALWLTRLDERLADAGQTALPKAAAARRGPDLWQAVLFALLGAVAAGGAAAGLLLRGG